MGSIDTLPPIISNYTRAGNAGQVTVAQVEAFDPVLILAISQFNQHNEAVGLRFGPGVANINLANFMDGADEVPVSITAVWSIPATPWLISQPSNFLFDALTIVPFCRPRQAPGLEEREQ